MATLETLSVAMVEAGGKMADALEKRKAAARAWTAADKVVKGLEKQAKDARQAFEAHVGSLKKAASK